MPCRAGANSSPPAKRRNKWVCALKTMLAEVGVYGPKGNPDAPPPPKRYTEVPWDQVQEDDRKREEEEKARVKGVPEPILPFVGWRLADEKAQYHDPIAGVFGETGEVRNTVAKAAGAGY